MEKAWLLFLMIGLTRFTFQIIFKPSMEGVKGNVRAPRTVEKRLAEALARILVLEKVNMSESCLVW